MSDKSAQVKRLARERGIVPREHQAIKKKNARKTRGKIYRAISSEKVILYDKTYRRHFVFVQTV